MPKSKADIRNLSEEDKNDALQGIIDDLYQEIDQLKKTSTGNLQNSPVAFKNFRVPGVTSSHFFQLRIDDADPTSLTLNITDIGEKAI